MERRQLAGRAAGSLPAAMLAGEPPASRQAGRLRSCQGGKREARTHRVSATKDSAIVNAGADALRLRRTLRHNLLEGSMPKRAFSKLRKALPCAIAIVAGGFIGAPWAGYVGAPAAFYTADHRIPASLGNSCGWFFRLREEERAWWRPALFLVRAARLDHRLFLECAHTRER